MSCEGNTEIKQSINQSVLSLIRVGPLSHLFFVNEHLYFLIFLNKIKSNPYYRPVGEAFKWPKTTIYLLIYFFIAFGALQLFKNFCEPNFRLQCLEPS